MNDRKDDSEDLVKFSSRPISPRDVTFDLSKEHPKQLVEIDKREVEFDEEKQQYVYTDEDGGDNK